MVQAYYSESYHVYMYTAKSVDFAQGYGHFSALVRFAQNGKVVNTEQHLRRFRKDLVDILPNICIFDICTVIAVEKTIAPLVRTQHPSR